MSNITMVENYLSWKREKDMYPPRWTPEEWMEELIMSEARVRLNLIKELLEQPELDPVEFAVQAQSIVYDPLGTLMQDDEDEQDE